MKLNQYEWDPENDVIGNGAFAEVFRAKDNNGHLVALKIYREAIAKGSTGGSFQGKYTLEQEYKKGGLLAHTNVAPWDRANGSITWMLRARQPAPKSRS